MAIFTSFLAGILAAFTPCILVLFPALVYRFTTTPKKNLPKELFAFTVSFIGVFIIIAMFLSEVLSSTIKQGFQLGIGLLFVVLGVLAITNRFNPLHFPLIQNPLLFGVLFAIIASVNPCSFAYLGIIATTNTSMLVLSFILFALGLIIPSILFAVFGKTLFSKIKKTQRYMNYMNKLMDILLIAMGVYLMIKITYLGRADVITATILLGLTFFILLRSFYFFQRKINIAHILLIIALLAIMLAAIWHCDTHIEANKETTTQFSYLSESTPSCSADVAECSVCRRCAIIFGLAALLGSGAILGNVLWQKKLVQKKN